MDEIIVSERMPVLALRGLTLFPKQKLHFDVGREKSARAMEAAMKKDQRIFLVAQRDIQEDDPGQAGLYEIGTVGRVVQILKIQGDQIRVLVEGEYRAKLQDLSQTEPYLMGRVESVSELPGKANPARVEAMIREGCLLFDEFLDLMQKPAPEQQLRLMSVKDSGLAADILAQNTTISFEDKARLLAQLNPVRRLETTLKLLRHELEVLRLEAEIQEKTHDSMEKAQRDYFLREQMRVIRTELV